MKEVLNYCNKQHSTINVAALDISKAFDNVNHFVLFNERLGRSVPVCLAQVLVCWYGKCSAVVIVSYFSYICWCSSSWHTVTNTVCGVH